MSSNDKHKSTPSKLSLLTKHKSQTTSSIVFPTFRFSPESEEIQEITYDTEESPIESVPEASGGSADGSRTSPEPSSSKQGGDVSPLKEYIMKHKWANKWDKRSLSLDLDLKGKIITAIEDKRRSFVSHFYNEEDEDPGLISTSQSIPEQLISTQDEDCDSIHSDSALVRSHGFNFQEENNTDYYEEFQLSSSLPCTPAEFKPTNTITSTVDPLLNENNLRDLIIEEIGVDCCVDEDMVDMDSSALREFVLQPDSLRELFQGIPALYNPPAVIGSSRAFPIQEIVEDERPPSAVPSEEMIHDVESDSDLTVSSLVKRILRDIVRDSWVKYWIAVFACLCVLNLPSFIANFLWFILGIIGATVVIGPFRLEEACEKISASRSMAIGATPSIVDKQSGEFQRSQGWMLTFPIESETYSPLTHHLRSTKVVFIRIHGYNLLVSYPHSKHKIPKRRLWNDPVINTDHMFVRHAQYNLHGAKIEIVPIGLSKKRVWCKKYPISITLACSDHFVGKIHEVVEDDAVNFNSKEDGKVDFKNTRVKGQVTKEACDGRVLFLFARTDREKDDWYRRLITATKSTAASTPRSSSPSALPDFNSFVRYMKRACPTLKYATTSPTTPRNDWETVSISSVPKSSGSSSRKSTPEKEHSYEHLLTPSFLNAFIARLFYDFLKSPRWTNEIRSLIDRKLFFIRKPPFVESIRVKELDLGSCMPVFLTASAPLLDSQGLWVDLEMQYTGNMIITLEMYVNLLKMRSEEKEKLDERKRRASTSREHAMFDSDADDSGESSESDEDELALEEKMLEKSTENRGKLMKYADSIAKSSVMKNKHVQKVVGNIAATPIILTVEIKRVTGVLAVNLPPVPSDRVWVGFRGNPVVEISARPKFGERALGFSYLTEWIKRKLLLEFQRVMVCPNMMDITVGLMEFNLPK